MPFHEPVLDIVLFPWKKETQPGKLFQFQYRKTMSLSYINDTFVEDCTRYDFGQSVEEVGDDPIEHFN